MPEGNIGDTAEGKREGERRYIRGRGREGERKSTTQ
jgi:hypothetical protein